MKRQAGTVRGRTGRWVGAAAAALVAMPASAAGTVLTVNDDATGPGPAVATCASPEHATISAAVTAASAGDTIAVCAGTYAENVTVNKALTLLGAQAGVDARTRAGAETVIAPGGGQGFTVREAATIDGFTFRGATQGALGYGNNHVGGTQMVVNNIFDGNRSAVLGIIADDSLFSRNRVLGSTNHALEMNTLPQDSIEISENLFENNLDDDILFIGSRGPYDGAVIRGNASTGGAGIFVRLQRNNDTEIIDNVVTDTTATAIAIQGGSNGTLIAGNTISGANTGNAVTTTDPYGYGRNSGTEILGNTISGRLAALRVLANPTPSTSDSVEVHFNRIVGNAQGIINEVGSGGAVDAENNWWGCNGGPGQQGCDPVLGDVDDDPNLVLRIGASPSSISTGGATSQISADLLTNSLGQTPAGNEFPGGATVSFTTSLGTLAPSSDALDAAVAASTLTSGATAGTATVGATFDNQTVATPVTFSGAPTKACGDGVDNDGDGATDYPDDPGCKSAGDNNETNAQCNDDLDNDGDGDIDFPDDPGCKSLTDNSETNAQCNDELDNDTDGDSDFPDDPGCKSAADNNETNPQCNDDIDNDGDGFNNYPNDLGCKSLTDNSEDSDSPPT